VLTLFEKESEVKKENGSYRIQLAAVLNGKVSVNTIEKLRNE
jgi:hypothetical protein